MAATFYWRCEGTTLDGTHDKSDGDTTASLVGSATAISSTRAFQGTNSVSCDGPSDYAEFSTASIVNQEDGCVGFAFNIDTGWVDGSVIGSIVQAATLNNHYYIKISGSAGSGGIDFETSLQGGGSTTVSTGDIGLTNDTWYFVIGRWDFTNRDLRVEVYSSTGTSLGNAENLSVNEFHFPQSGFSTIDTMRFGESAGGNIDLYVDNIFIGDNYSEPLEDNFDISSWTQYGGGSTTTESIESGSFTITGATVGSLHQHIDQIQAGSFSLTGTDVSTGQQHVDQVESGSFTLTGNDVSSLRSHVDGIQSGSFALSGSDVDTLRSLVGTAEAGSFTLSGSDINSLQSRLVVAESGAFALTGNLIDSLYNRVDQIQSGLFTLTGSDVTTIHQTGTPTLQAESGTFLLSGSDVADLYHRVESILSGLFSLTGNDITSLLTLVIDIESGTFALTGNDIDELYHRIEVIESGSFVITGIDVVSTYNTGHTAAPAKRTIIVQGNSRSIAVGNQSRTITVN